METWRNGFDCQRGGDHGVLRRLVPAIVVGGGVESSAVGTERRAARGDSFELTIPAALESQRSRWRSSALRSWSALAGLAITPEAPAASA